MSNDRDDGKPSRRRVGQSIMAPHGRKEEGKRVPARESNAKLLPVRSTGERVRELPLFAFHACRTTSCSVRLCLLVATVPASPRIPQVPPGKCNSEPTVGQIKVKVAPYLETQTQGEIRRPTQDG